MQIEEEPADSYYAYYYDYYDYLNDNSCPFDSLTLYFEHDSPIKVCGSTLPDSLTTAKEERQITIYFESDETIQDFGFSLNLYTNDLG